jgi:hypothetical protein
MNLLVRRLVTFFVQTLPLELITSSLTSNEPEKIKSLILEEVAYLVDKKFSWESIHLMPVYERKWYVEKWVAIDEKIKQETSAASRKNSSGTRKRSL